MTDEPARDPIDEREWKFLVESQEVLVHLRPTPPFEVHCPSGEEILYGEIVSRGNGVDLQNGTCREMPPLGACVAFHAAEAGENETPLAGARYRLLNIDDLLVAFAPVIEW